MTADTRPRISVDETTLDVGNRNCTRAVKRSAGDLLWISRNLPKEQQLALNALTHHLITAAEYLDLESSDGLPLDVWCEFRDDLSEALLDSYGSPELFALVHTVRKYDIPKQFLFDILDGVDGWIRHRGFETYDELEVFAYRFGGAALTAAVPIVGYERKGYEQAAVAAGQALFLTHMLANFVREAKLNKIFIARQDIADTGLSISHIKVRKPCPGLKPLVELYGSRIEELMYRGGQLNQYLDFDARRCFKSLMAVHWAMLVNMRSNPEILLDPEGVISNRQMFGLKARHVMGLEGNIPVISEIGDGHH